MSTTTRLLTISFAFVCLVQTNQKLADASGATGWRSKIPGFSKSNDTEPLKNALKIIQCMTAEERADAGRIGRLEKMRIAQDAGKTVTDVNFLLYQYDQMKSLSAWCRKRTERGLKLPESQSEMTTFMIEDRPEISATEKKRRGMPLRQPQKLMHGQRTLQRKRYQ